MRAMNLHLLRTFTAVVTHGGFGRAAEALHVSQPAVSKAVRELESQLDVALMEHGGKQVRLTEAGALLYQHARAIFSLEEVAMANLAALKALECGQITIGASMTIATYLLPPIVARFLDRNPGIDVRIVTGNTETVTRGLYGYELDVALVGTPVSDDRVELTHWYDHELIIVAPARHPLCSVEDASPDMLNDQRWVVREEGSGTREFTTRLLDDVGIHTHRVLEVGSVEGLVQCVVVGLGLAMVPMEAAQDLIKLGKLDIVALPDVRFIWPLYGLRLHDRPLSPAVNEFCKMAGVDSTLL